VKTYHPDLMLIASCTQKEPTPGDIQYVAHAVQSLRKGEDIAEFTTVDLILGRWPYLAKRFGISTVERRNWERLHVAAQARDAVESWKSGRGAFGLHALKIYRDERLPPANINVTEKQLGTMIRQMEKENARIQLELLRSDDEGASVVLLLEELNESELTPKDIGVTKKELKEYALREAHAYARQIANDEDEMYPFGGLIGLVQSGLITYAEIGMPEKRFRELHKQHVLEEARELLEGCRGGDTSRVPRLRMMFSGGTVTPEEIGTSNAEITGFVAARAEQPN